MKEKGAKVPKKSTYIEHYQKLKDIAEAMRDIEEPDIDQLVVMVNEATEAYKNCQARIEAVEKVLGLESK
ncbi:MAG: ATPase [Candidatus Parabeggiatoa sp. nov. 3]|mgnify:CR=1 FL=1|nr:MAG: ATPase [Gammaproteobacteria bacterium]RKZ75167.1 MAG: ATPase [Gammaproteobacteria bacterium]